jgi:hypothetical protein
MIRQAIARVFTFLDAALHGQWLRGAATVVTLLIAMTWLLTYVWSFGLCSKSERFEWFLAQGSLHVNTFPQGYGSRPNVRGWRWTPGFRIWRTTLWAPLYFNLPEVRKPEAARWYLMLPLYLPLILLVGGLVYPHFPPVRRRWRRICGLCPKCGYDLTGNVSGVCPECGTKVERP